MHGPCDLALQLEAKEKAGGQEGRAFAPRSAVLAEVGPIEIDMPDASSMLEGRHAPKTTRVRVLDHGGYFPVTAVMEDRDREPSKRAKLQDLAAVFF